MCGIAGKLNFSDNPVDLHLLQRMCDVIAHRGPDDWGIHCSGPVGLGNRRLSIIDLAGGHQPICNEDETIWIVFNGEIYNFPKLAEDLLRRGHCFKTRSDTEVIVHLYEEYGLECLQHLNGMFAFAIWDEPRKRLFIARDRLGKKPLCYAQTSTSLVFASEIAALLQDPQVPRELNLDALDLYLCLLYVPAPHTMFKGVHKLPAGHYLLVENGKLRVERYWDVHFEPKSSISEEEAAEQVRILLAEAVRCRLISDVPVGAFLSGGIDSSAVVALMSRAGHGPVRTFSIGFEGFEDETRNDLPYARQIARQYGTLHEEMIVRPNVADLLPTLVRHYGEPFGDGSAVPTYYVSQLARSAVKVVLSGDGGDEVFGGYNWYLDTRANNPWRPIPSIIRQGTGNLLNALGEMQWRRAAGAVKGAVSTLQQVGNSAADPLRRYASIHRRFSQTLLSHLYLPDVQHDLNGGAKLDPALGGRAIRNYAYLDQIAYLDHKLYLPDDILVKVDIASMANSLETRAPFLDYRLVEFVASLPTEMKVAHGATKRLLRLALKDIVPDAVLNRPKMGFGPPMDKWMSEDLFPMARDILLGPRLTQRGLFDRALIAAMLAQHRSGQMSHGYHLWLLLVFELWCQMFLDGNLKASDQGA